MCNMNHSPLSTLSTRSLTMCNRNHSPHFQLAVCRCATGTTLHSFNSQSLDVHTGTTLHPPQFQFVVSRHAHYSTHWHSKPTHEQSTAMISSPHYAFICVFCTKLHSINHTSGAARLVSDISGQHSDIETSGTALLAAGPFKCTARLLHFVPLGLSCYGFLPSLAGSPGSASRIFSCRRRQSGALLCFVQCVKQD
jgi:hypothetical protein